MQSYSVECNINTGALSSVLIELDRTSHYKWLLFHINDLLDLPSYAEKRFVYLFSLSL